MTESLLTTIRGHGVAGVHIDTHLSKTDVEVTIVGTAIAPDSPEANRTSIFVSDRSLAEFVLLRRAGWQALGLVFGASFVFVPRRSPIEVSAQTARSVELTNFTTALYTARSAAMERMQAQALQLEAAGVVGVRLADGPAEFAHHAMRFTALGTAVGPLGNVSDTVAPVPTVALNDPVP